MKFFNVLLIAPVLVSATIIKPSTTTNCGNNIGDISACGCTNMRNYNIQSARVDFQRATARFFEKLNCVNPRISVASDQCFRNSNWPRLYSVLICGGTCSNACP
ncbi:hypothetical protein BKA66DRAFT_479861 [Pyrenochaeta sp. MPI-SDFR-AT-0127]|nr:hypothetical protein BKA66DRAFT_479861 [Pyrenochaeta sp. MPI-SDFR-AT-0127]